MKLAFRAALIAALSLVGWQDSSHAAEPQSVSFNVGGVEFLGSGPNYIDFGLGAFDVNEEGNGEIAVAGRLELRFSPCRVATSPILWSPNHPTPKLRAGPVIGCTERGTLGLTAKSGYKLASCSTDVTERSQ